MNAEEGLAFVKQLGEKKQIYLSDVHEAVFIIIWEGYKLVLSEIPIERYPILMRRTIRDDASDFYKLLDQIFESKTKIFKRNLKAIVKSEFEKRSKHQKLESKLYISKNKNIGNIHEILSEDFHGRTVELQPLEHWNEETFNKNLLIELRIKAISININGLIAIISKKIALSEGNIYNIKFEENKNTIIIVLSIAINNIIQLTNKINMISVNDILRFNTEEELTVLFNTFHSKNNTGSIEDKKTPYQALSLYKNQSLIKDIIIVIKFKITVCYSRTYIADLNCFLSNKNILLILINIDYNANKNEKYIEVDLSFSIVKNGEFELTESIIDFSTNLKKLHFVREVELLNVRVT